MAVINTNLTCDLQHAVRVQYLDGVVFSQDNQANRINVAVYDNGEPAEISGTVTANVIRADGGTVAATDGTIEGNVASITLPAAAYLVPGVVSIVVKLTASGVVTTIAAVVSNVYQSTTDTAVDPGTIIPSIQTLIASIEAAVATIPADYSSLWQKLAPNFDPDRSGGYAIDEYCTYNGGLYRFTKDHTGAWVSGDAVSVSVGTDLYKTQKSVEFAGESIKNGSEQMTGNRMLVFKQGRYGTSGAPSTGAVVTFSKNTASLYACAISPCEVGDVFFAHVYGGSGGQRAYFFVDAEMRVVGTSYATTNAEINGVLKAPEGSAYVLFNNVLDRMASGFYAYKNPALVQNLQNLRSQATMELTLVNGNINSDIGANYDTNKEKRLRTSDYIPAPFGFSVDVPEGFRCVVYGYKELAYTTYVRSSRWLTGQVTENNPDYYYVKFVFSKVDDTALTPEDIPNPIVLTQYLYTDETLTQHGKAADAYTVGNLLASKVDYIGQLNSSDDLNATLGTQFMASWRSGEAPVNSPTAYPATIIQNGSTGVYSQFVINRLGRAWWRCYYTGIGFTDWREVAKQADIDQITETITGVVSEATITGAVDDTYTLHGITFTKKADNEFTLTGNSSKTVGKGFNVLLGANQITTTAETVMTPNITTPGVYTLAYKTSGTEKNTENLFAITDSTFKNRKYIHSGESFTVEDDPVCLFVYGVSDVKFYSDTLKVKWALYEGEEYIGFPYVENGQLIAVDPIARNSALKRDEEETGNEFLSWGFSNTLANAKQIVEIKWTPTAATMPKGNNGETFTQGVTYSGIPYSSVRDNDKSVGTNVSFRTFMTAVHDPHSVLYTRISTTQNASTYYGSVCSSLCNHAYFIGLHLTNYFFGQCDWFETIPMQDIQPGDCLYEPGHVAMVYSVTKDKWGRIEEVVTMEEWFPTPRFRRYTSYQKFLNGRPGYIARRYKYLSGVGYEQIPYVRCFDEDPQDIIYPDVQTDHGDEAVFGYCANADPEYTDYVNISGVRINVIDEKDYSSIVVTREGTEAPIWSTGNIQSFDIPASLIVPGLYTITATGAENTSVSTFFVADVSGSYNRDTGIITYHSANATPVLVDIYNLPMKEGKISPACQPIPLTDADRTAGQIDLNTHEIVTTSDWHSYLYAKVTFDTPYGQAIWRSEAHATWQPISQ